MPTTADLKPCGRCKKQPAGDDKFYCADCLKTILDYYEQQRQKALDVLWADCGGIVRDFEQLDVDDNNRTAMRDARAWPRCHDEPDDPAVENGAYLWGDVGTGKTTIAKAIARQWITYKDHQGESCRFVVFRDLLHRARSAMTRGDKDSPIDELFRCPLETANRGPSLLVIDDVGAERPTAWAREILATIIEHRYSDSYSPTIVTSNYSPSQLVRRLAAEDKDTIAGKRIVSRLVEKALILHVPGHDRRVQRHQDAA